MRMEKETGMSSYERQHKEPGQKLFNGIVAAGLVAIVIGVIIWYLTTQ